MRQIRWALFRNLVLQLAVFPPTVYTPCQVTTVLWPKQRLAIVVLQSTPKNSIYCERLAQPALCYHDSIYEERLGVNEVDTGEEGWRLEEE